MSYRLEMQALRANGIKFGDSCGATVLSEILAARVFGGSKIPEKKNTRKIQAVSRSPLYYPSRCFIYLLCHMVYQRISADRKQQALLEGWEIEQVAAALGKSLSVGRKAMIYMYVSTLLHLCEVAAGC
jgi:hypothetical protein